MTKEIFESPFFEGKQVRWDTLLDFGFVQIQDTFSYSESFMDGDFEARIRILADGQVWGQIWDLGVSEPYLGHLVTVARGSYVNQIREAYGAILTQVASKCFEETPFVAAQANRLNAYIQRELGDQADFPFKRLPEARVFRRQDNQKWYALLLTTKAEKLSSQLVDIDPNSQVTIVNLKIEEGKLNDLLACKGYYPSYHMNKSSWISVVLNDTVSDEQVFFLVRASKNLVASKTYRADQGPDYWLLPANPTYFDVDKALAQKDDLEWGHRAQIKPGDRVGLYMTAPRRNLAYVLEVLDLEQEEKTMTLKCLLRLPDSAYPISFLKELGVKTVRGPRRMTKELVEDLLKTYPQIREKDSKSSAL